jgi:hypothetical protein
MQVANSVLQSRKKVYISVDHIVGNVTVAEEVSGYFAHHQVLRNTSINTSWIY